MKKIIEWFRLNTVRKKVFFLSKLTGGVIILFYVFTSELPTSRSMSFAIWLILLIAVITGVNVMLGRFISKPLSEINHTAGQMAKLDFSAHCNICTDDEFGEISQNLNTMFSNLQETLEKLETANKQLEKDIIQEHLLLTQRKELVDSLSHEMKTPLGVVRAYVEGLKEETDEQKKQQYMDVILAATDRMNTMIVSLLDLSALEAGAAKLNEERFDFIELVETVAGRLLIDTPNASYQFTYELPDKKTFLYADKHRMEQVLNNLILNAKNHTCDGDKIHLSVTCHENKVRFSIFNQGVPIPTQDIAKVWIKFYRGKSTQNKATGSGLGLSIVTQILSMYHTDYGVQNLPDGVEFYFDFPTIA
ncbi:MULTISPECIES: HAMP domain-containing sensor histidine kinase [unclassified Sedimentibacter]|uniref:HAMP domain-containing sensor histidine kinase n=1 Tax=unclassified Sedimentibacter TaxID=2649220 RepID=UPI0027DFEAB7|nr:HAMP domain-containing sensor histidine kinase [Sedimentibacter sp. MB35-C1]WMJ77061.1 HAMP domain-containing sensor histidine kinase [Sedimentibacter sp. MB35-C1]